MVVKADKGERLPHLTRIELGRAINAGDPTSVLARAYHDDESGFEPIVIDITVIDADQHTDYDTGRVSQGTTLYPVTDDARQLADAFEYTTTEKPADKFVTRFGIDRDWITATLLNDAFGADPDEVADATNVSADRVEQVSQAVNQHIQHGAEMRGTSDLPSTVTVNIEDVR